MQFFSFSSLFCTFRLLKGRGKNSRELKKSPTRTTTKSHYFISLSNKMFQYLPHQDQLYHDGLRLKTQARHPKAQQEATHMLWFYSLYDRRVTGLVDLEEQTGGRKREALRFQPRLHVSILSCDPSLHPWRLLRAGCKDLTENKVWRVLKDTFIWEKQYAGKDINYLSHTVHLPGHGGLNCTHTALNAKKCSIWRHKFKPKLPFRSLTYCSVLWDSQVLRISQTTIVTEGMATTWSSWKTD